MNWEDIIISKGVADYVKKICYRNWGLDENGRRKKE